MRSVRIGLLLRFIVFSFTFILNMADASFQSTEVISPKKGSSGQMAKADLIAGFPKK